MGRKNQFNLFFYLLFLNLLNGVRLHAYENVLDNLINKYDATVENIEFDSEGRMLARKEISTNKQILIISTGSLMTSEEDYQFKEYFSRSDKEKLVGRLLIERFIGNSSYYHSYIESLPKLDEISDYYHYTDSHKEELSKRSFIKYNWLDRKNDYETLIRKVPTNVCYNIFNIFNIFRQFHHCY
jgi:hypothetical protein